MLDPARYYEADRSQLLERLCFVTAELMSLHRLLFDAVQAERRVRDEAILAAGPEATVSSAHRDADLVSYKQWVTVKDLDAQVRSYQEERDLIRYLVEVTDARG